jgi:hypothetical protein
MDHYEQASLRHFVDAETLAQHQRWGGASHLVGFAAECALKLRIKSLSSAGPHPKGHFPEFIEVAKKHLNGHQHRAIRSLISSPDFMRGWNVHLRYSDDASVGKDDFERWQANAKRVMAVVGSRRNSK